MIKLFRDYVFHQVNEQGQPVLDLAHVIECLNKLEVGSAEKVLLVSDSYAMTAATLAAIIARPLTKRTATDMTPCRCWSCDVL
jgi:hypothetical protein